MGERLIQGNESTDAFFYEILELEKCYSHLEGVLQRF
jgi:hypothetical protein